MQIETYLNTRTLILGDINTGKTTLTGDILNALCLQGVGRRMVIVDMAPTIPETLARQKGLAGAGGRLRYPDDQSILYLSGRFEAPRLSSATEAEAMEKARSNRESINDLFHKLDGSFRDILLINDISMYLQSGSAHELIFWIDKAATVIANGYWGEKLGSGVLTQRERSEMIRLRAYFETCGKVVVLP